MALFDRFFYYLDGKLYWKVARGKKRIGDRAGNSSTSGYRYVMLDGKNYLEHRVIWRIVNGAWPTGELDHINGTRNDNRIENLRECSRKENLYNTSSHVDSSSKYKGVDFRKSRNKWRASCCIGGVKVVIGQFSTELEAARAYDEYVKIYHKEFIKENIIGTV